MNGTLHPEMSTLRPKRQPGRPPISESNPAYFASQMRWGRLVGIGAVSEQEAARANGVTERCIRNWVRAARTFTGEIQLLHN